ncbi:MAG: MFS transporter [Actinobacteria bacterium HGW-Actinobacteria-4]|nr:MAG: MFS transporter [Actinobacteria bacterium HGW-Actinobacteria-4]
MTSEPASTKLPSLWRNRPYVLLLSGETVSQFGAQITNVAMPIAAVSYLAASEFEVGLLGAAQMAAFLLLGLPAGALVDRLSRRRVMIWANVIRALLIAIIPALWLMGELSVSWLVVLALLTGACAVFFDVAYMSIVPSLVPRAQLADANSRLESTMQTARIAGPALGGALAKIVAAPLLPIGATIGYLASAFALSRIANDVPEPRAAGSRLWSEIREGTSFVFRHPIIGRIVASAAGANLFGSLIMTMMPILILRELGFSELLFGLLLTIGSVGAVAGGLTAPAIARRVGEGHAIVVTYIATALAAFGFVAVFFVPDAWAFWVLAVTEFWMGFTILAFNVCQVSVRQKLCPPRLLGRMNASIRFAVWGVSPVGAIASGVLASQIGLEATFWIGAVGALAASAFLVFSPLWRMRAVPEPDWYVAAGQ